jgi:hypothetical protein
MIPRDWEEDRRRWKLWCWQPLRWRDLNWLGIMAVVSSALVCAAVWRVVWLWMILPLAGGK